MSDATIIWVVVLASTTFFGYCVGNYVGWRERARLYKALRTIGQLCDGLNARGAGDAERARSFASVDILVKKTVPKL